VANEAENKIKSTVVVEGRCSFPEIDYAEAELRVLAYINFERSKVSMSLPDWLDEACDTVDAAIFTGDTLADSEALKTFSEHLERWSRGVKEWKDSHPELND
jgi:hypothetical protein